MACQNCFKNNAVMIRSLDSKRVCKECFLELFETEIHEVIVKSSMFIRNTRIGIGVSGGKDSTVLAYVLDKLNKKYDYGLELVLLCIDEGIDGYRVPSIETVHKNADQLGLELHILSYKDLFNITMDDVARKTNYKGNCMYCGIFRRQGLEEAARRTKVECIVTGHNADDMAETILLNFIRGDHLRMRRCTQVRTNKSQETLNDIPMTLPRCKPFKLTYQKEIVLYAFYRKLLYFSTECTYAPYAARSEARLFLKDIENIDPSIIVNLIKSGEEFAKKDTAQPVHECIKCSHSTAKDQKICKSCSMLENLRKMG